MGFIQFKRGPSDKLEKVTKAPGEPILLTDIDELLIYKNHSEKPLVFKPFKNYLELESLENDFELNDAIGKIWLDYKNEINFGTLYDGSIQIIPISKLLSEEKLTDKLNNFLDQITNPENPNFIVIDSAKKLSPGFKINLSGDANGNSQIITGESDINLSVDISEHKNTKASQDELGHIKIGRNFNITEDGSLTINNDYLQSEIISLVLALS